MKRLITATAIAAALLVSGTAAKADVSKACKRTLTPSMINTIGRDTAREMMKEYVPNQIKIVYDAHWSERADEAKETATLAAETVISVTIEVLEKQGMKALSEDCINEVRSVALKGTAVFVPKLAQKLIALAATDDDDVVGDREQLLKKASDELAFAYQNLTVMGVTGVVMTVKK